MWLFCTEVTIPEKKDPSNNRGGEGRVERRSEFPVL